MRLPITAGVFSLAVLLGFMTPARGNDPKTAYASMAPAEQYRMPGSDEVALARSAAPPSISDEAEIMTLGEKGYSTAVKGKNGFVCLIERSWASDFDDAQFWNPKLRAPICHNSGAAQSILPRYLERTRWVLSGVSRSDMLDRTKSAVAANTLALPAPGALSYMMSKQGNLGDGNGHWHPHLMFYLARTTGASWGADLAGSPISSAAGNPEPITTFFVPVPRWSDGTHEDMQKN